MTAISTRMPAVAVEYDSGKRRVTKKFEDAYEAKRFYIAKEAAGKNPKVTAGEIPNEEEPAAAPAEPAAEPKPKRKGKAAKAAKEETAAAETAAPVEAPAEPAEEPKPEPKPAVEKDRFGNRIGTKLATFNAAISETPKSMKELLTDAGMDLADTLYNHANALVKAGLVVKENGKYRLP